MKKTSLFLASCAVMATCAISQADESMYVSVEGGYSLPASKVKSGFPTHKKFKAGTAFGIGAGCKFSDSMRADFTLNYNPRYEYKHNVNGTSYKQNLSSFRGMVNGYYDMNMGSVSPYLTAGVGISSNKAKGLMSSNTNLSSNRHNKTNFAYQLGLGASMKVANNVDASLGYRFVDLGKFTTTSFDKTKVYKGRLTAHEFMLGLRFGL